MRSGAPPLLAADVIVQSDSAVLLVVLRRAYDAPDGWRLPGDILRWGEHPEACARRVLQDQVGLNPEYVVLADVESTAGEQWQVTFHYRCEADRAPQPGPAVREARFFQVEHLPSTAHGTWEREVIYRVIAGGGDLQ